MSYLRSQDPTLERSFRGHKDVITGLCFKPSMSQLASSSMDHSGPVTSLDFASAGQVLASSSRDNTVRLWTPNVKGDVTVFKAHTSTVRMVQFSGDSESLVTCSDDKSIKLWSTHRTKFQYSLTGHLNWVRAAKFSPDSRLILSGSDDKTVKLWDLNSKTCIKTYWDHTGVVSSVAFHPSGTVIATTSMDRSIKLFDLRTHKLIQHYGDAHGSPAAGNQLEGSTLSVGGANSVCFGGNQGEWLISTGMDGLVKVWDVKEGHLFYTLHGHKNGPTTAAVFSPQSDYFATGGSDSQVMVWKSNFDKIDRITISENESVQYNIPHSTSPYPHDPHMIRTDFSTSTKYRPKSASPDTKFNISNALSGISHKPNTGNIDKQFLKTDLEPVNVSAPIISNVSHMDAESGVTEKSPIHIEHATSPLQIQTVPDQVASALSHISRQMDILTQTMSILENRLTLNEDRLINLSEKVEIVIKTGPKEAFKPNILEQRNDSPVTPSRQYNLQSTIDSKLASPKKVETPKIVESDLDQPRVDQIFAS